MLGAACTAMQGHARQKEEGGKKGKKKEREGKMNESLACIRRRCTWTRKVDADHWLGASAGAVMVAQASY
jgi:hypothetical protein